MRKDDRQKFAEIVVGFAELKGKQLSAPAIELFWNAMQSWSIEEFTAAANHLVATCEFMPTPKDFFDLRKASRPTAGEAWARVLEHCRRGDYRRGEGISPAIDKAARALGGYRAIAMLPVEQLQFLERRFASHYGEIADVEEARDGLALDVSPGVEDGWFLPKRDGAGKGLVKL
jgi:hypothetical protein